MLLFALERPVMPVDTARAPRRAAAGHHPGEKVTADQVHPLLTELAGAHDAEQVYAVHVDFVRHGRRICHARRPACGELPAGAACARRPGLSSNSGRLRRARPPIDLMIEHRYAGASDDKRVVDGTSSGAGCGDQSPAARSAAASAAAFAQTLPGSSALPSQRSSRWVFHTSRQSRLHANASPSSTKYCHHGSVAHSKRARAARPG